LKCRNHHDPALLDFDIAGSSNYMPRFWNSVIIAFGSALSTSLEAAATAARKAGRASYVSESLLSGHKDPGAEAVAILFEELFRTAEILR
jgi:DAK2 domain